VKLHELVQRQFLNIPATPGDFYVNCPFCIEEVGRQDTKHRFGINTATGVGNCHRCEKKHSAKGGRRYWFRELCRVLNLSFQMDREDEDQETEESKIEEPVKTSTIILPPEFEPLWRNVNDRVGRKALKYLLSRRVTKAQIKKHRIGFCAVGEYAFRIVFPVYSSMSRLKALVGRDFTGISSLRYLNSKGAKIMYNVPKRKKSVAVLGEGIFDALSGERALPHVDCIAGLGKTLTKRQVRTLAKYDEVVLWVDPNRAGVEGTIKRALALQKKKVKVMIVPPLEDVSADTDLGDLREWEVKQRFADRVPYSPSLAARMRVRVSFVETPKKKRNRVEWKPKVVS
jgi:DNA primase